MESFITYFTNSPIDKITFLIRKSLLRYRTVVDLNALLRSGFILRRD